MIRLTQLFSTVILFIFILLLMPLPPAAAATTWGCNVGWSNGAVTFGYGDTESAARLNLDENIAREPFNKGPVTITRPVQCSSSNDGGSGGGGVVIQPPTTGAGYFDYGNTGYYRENTQFCGFVSPNHRKFFRHENSASFESISDISSYNYTGACRFPSGYFNDGKTTFYSSGNRTFCGFPDPQSYKSHKLSNPGKTRFGTFDRDPNLIMQYTGAC